MKYALTSLLLPAPSRSTPHTGTLYIPGFKRLSMRPCLPATFVHNTCHKQQLCGEARRHNNTDGRHTTTEASAHSQLRKIAARSRHGRCAGALPTPHRVPSQEHSAGLEHLLARHAIQLIMARAHQHRRQPRQSPAPVLLLAMMLAWRARADCRVGMGPVNVRMLPTTTSALAQTCEHRCRARETG